MVAFDSISGVYWYFLLISYSALLVWDLVEFTYISIINDTFDTIILFGLELVTLL